MAAEFTVRFSRAPFAVPPTTPLKVVVVAEPVPAVLLIVNSNSPVFAVPLSRVSSNKAVAVLMITSDSIVTASKWRCDVTVKNVPVNSVTPPSIPDVGSSVVSISSGATFPTNAPLNDVVPVVLTCRSRAEPPRLVSLLIVPVKVMFPPPVLFMIVSCSRTTLP